MKEISAQRLADLNDEWDKAKEEAEAGIAQQKPAAVPMYCSIHRIVGECLLCKKKATPANLKKIRTPEMDKIRFDNVAGGRAENEMKKLKTKIKIAGAALINLEGVQSFMYGPMSL